SDGSLDSSFGSGGEVTTSFKGQAIATAEAIQNDGKIVLVGETQGANGDDFALARYNPDGSLDTTFGTGGKVTTDFAGADDAFSVAIQSDGKIVVAGSSQQNTGEDFALARYNSDGTLDTSFGAGGEVLTAIAGGANGVAIQADGKIVAAGF